MEQFIFPSLLTEVSQWIFGFLKFSIQPKNKIKKNNLLNLFIVLAIAFITSIFPAMIKKDYREAYCKFAMVLNELFPRLIVSGIGFYLALFFIVRTIATETLTRSIFSLIAFTFILWVVSLGLWNIHQDNLKEVEEKNKKINDGDHKIVYPISSILKGNGIIFLFWLVVAIGISLSKPLNVNINKASNPSIVNTTNNNTNSNTQSNSAVSPTP